MDWGAIASQNGPLGIFLGALFYLYVRKHIATGRELALREGELQRERDERKRERDECERDKIELRRELAFWRDLAWSSSKLADHVIGAIPSSNGPPSGSPRQGQD
jgi:hypothetical protein